MKRASVVAASLSLALYTLCAVSGEKSDVDRAEEFVKGLAEVWLKGEPEEILEFYDGNFTMSIPGRGLLEDQESPLDAIRSLGRKAGGFFAILLIGPDGKLAEPVAIHTHVFASCFGDEQAQLMLGWYPRRTTDFPEEIRRLQQEYPLMPNFVLKLCKQEGRWRIVEQNFTACAALFNAMVHPRYLTKLESADPTESESVKAAMEEYKCAVEAKDTKGVLGVMSRSLAGPGITGYWDLERSLNLNFPRLESLSYAIEGLEVRKASDFELVATFSAKLQIKKKPEYEFVKRHWFADLFHEGRVLACFTRDGSAWKIVYRRRLYE